jgi:uncharacterized protein (DUF58 family)
MRAALKALTTRGRCFVAAGLTAVLCGLGIPEPDLIRVGTLLCVLPILSAFTASRARYRLSCARALAPRRISAGAGAGARLTLRLTNVSRLRTGLLLAEDTLPYSLTGRFTGTGQSKPRFVLDRIEGGGSRELRYDVLPDTRGRYTIGPLRLRVADAFGLVEVGRSFASVSVLTVTPRIIPLVSPTLGGNWPGEGDRGRRTISATGEDDIAPRAYREGDSLHRVHWRSTARYGELMVRREEQHWRNSATLFLDTRRSAYSGSGQSSLFELAVSAAASIGIHLSGDGLDARLITDTGEVSYQGTFRDTLLDTLAVIGPSRTTSLRQGVSALSAGSGQIIALLGHLTDAQAREFATARRGEAPAMALLLGGPADGAAASILSGGGWRVATAGSADDLADAWRRLIHHPASSLAVQLCLITGSPSRPLSPPSSRHCRCTRSSKERSGSCRGPARSSPSRPREH